MNLSPHFTLEEATHSVTAISNGIDNKTVLAEVLMAARNTAAQMEKVREILDNNPIQVSSWIRCLALNRAIGSRDTSQHIKGEAVDFRCPEFGTAVQICQKLMKYPVNLQWNQLILEHSWIHIAWNSIPNMKQDLSVLSLLNSGHYAKGLTDPSGKPITS